MGHTRSHNQLCNLFFTLLKILQYPQLEVLFLVGIVLVGIVLVDSVLVGIVLVGIVLVDSVTVLQHLGCNSYY